MYSKYKPTTKISNHSKLGPGTYRICDSGWEYPTPVISGGSSGNYEFYWRYPDGCPCNKDNSQCSSGYCDDDSKKCENPSTNDSSCGKMGCIDYRSIINT